jgi:hypothetical protein
VKTSKWHCGEWIHWSHELFNGKSIVIAPLIVFDIED